MSLTRTNSIKQICLLYSMENHHLVNKERESTLWCFALVCWVFCPGVLGFWGGTYFWQQGKGLQWWFKWEASRSSSGSKVGPSPAQNKLMSDFEMSLWTHIYEGGLVRESNQETPSRSKRPQQLEEREEGMWGRQPQTPRSARKEVKFPCSQWRLMLE